MRALLLKADNSQPSLMKDRTRMDWQLSQPRDLIPIRWNLSRKVETKISKWVTMKVRHSAHRPSRK